jgi:hypothetical protein
MYGSSTVVGATSKVNCTMGVDEVGLEVGLALGEQLLSVDDGRVVAKARAEGCVVRRLTMRAEEEVSDASNLGLYEELVRDIELREEQLFVQKQTQGHNRTC